jgi:hypothetical protein
MKMRKFRKQMQDRIRHDRSWDWAFEKFVRAVVTASNKMAKAMEEAYAKSREEQHEHARG